MLKFIVSPIVGFIAFMAVFLLSHITGIGLVHAGGNPSVLTGFVCFIVAVIATIVTFNSFPKKSVKQSFADSVLFVKDTSNEISSMVDKDDSELYAIAENEIDEGVINRGLWSQALVAAEGNESKRKIEYMKLRVKQLKKR